MPATIGHAAARVRPRLGRPNDPRQPSVSRLGRKVRSYLELRGFNPLYLPAFRERGAQLRLRYATRSSGTGGVLGEAQQVYNATGIKDGGQARNVLGPFGIIEDVEDAGVDDGREATPQPIEREHVTDFERSVHPTPGSLRPSRFNGCGRDVNAQHLQAPLGQQERVLAGAASAVEDRWGDLPGIGKLDPDRLRSADVPGR